jgi:hypothetical protein
VALQFTDKELLPWTYRQKFLHYTELHAPEVLESLKALIPNYREVINDYPSTEDMREWLNGESDIEYKNNPEVAQSVKREILDYHLVWVDRYRTLDASQINITEETAWSNFLNLRNSFAEFIKAYGLSPKWLRSGLFGLLGDLAKSERHFNSLCYVYTHGWFPAHGEEIELRLEGWKINESWEEFEERAGQAFMKVLTKHKNKTQRSFRDNGYKQMTKPLDFTAVKWLVLWTVKRMSKAEILELIDKENEGSGKTYDLKSLEKAFRALKKYDLPVRVGNKSMS